MNDKELIDPFSSTSKIGINVPGLMLRFAVDTEWQSRPIFYFLAG